jgi:N-acetylglucosamine kinase-like BadF-type ATPase
VTLLLGVDGGATKTVAIVADAEGRVLGAGRDGSSDVHSAADPAEAIERVAVAVRVAMGAAGVSASSLGACVFSLCGADWPEDVTLYRTGLAAGLGLAEPPRVVNDALGALRAGTPDGVGVSLVLGTGGAIGASGPDGSTWFSGFRLEPSGAVGLGRHAYELLLRGEYADGAVPAFRPEALAALGVDSVEALVHAITRRGGLGDRGLAMLAPVLLEAEHAGDPAARAIILDHAAMLAAYVGGAARRAGLDAAGAVLVVTGGVLRHHCTDLLDAIVARLPGFRLVRPAAEPAFGALLLAADAAGIALDPERLRETAPDEALFRTL